MDPYQPTSISWKVSELFFFVAHLSRKEGEKDYSAFMLLPGLVFLLVCLTKPELLKVGLCGKDGIGGYEPRIHLFIYHGKPR